MKKRSKLILSIVLAILVLAGAALGVQHGMNQKKAEEVLTEEEWYNPEQKEFTITTKEELFKVAELSQYYDFKGQTILLGADIVVNEGNAAGWGETVPENVWVPIQGFAGTFDGQNHTISGIYAVGVNKSVGLFTDTDAACEIKNLRMENSYIKGLNDKGTGSIIGAGAGNLSSVYSDAIVICESDNAGGLVGYWKSKKTSGMENCWFDGSVESTSELSHYTGGLVGRVLASASLCKIEHCLNTAEVTSKGQEVGGLIGAVAGETTLWVTDSLSAGQVNAPEGSLTAGTVFGRLYGSASVNSRTSWAVKGDITKTIGTTEGTVKGVLASIEREKVSGTDAYINTTLDFDQHWAAIAEDTPVLSRFAGDGVSIAGLERKYDVSWYDEKQTQLHISTVAQLNGFALLSQAYGFSGQTVILDNDLVLNEGSAYDWAATAPANEWEMPIGRWVGEDGVTSGVAFSGTFDGNGHTISGLYIKLESKKAYNWGLFAKTKGTIKNLRLHNSYIGGVAGGNVGSIAGGLEGATLENVFSNATVNMDSIRVGGLTGLVEGRGKESTIRNSWFAGIVKGRERVGGFVGNINQDVSLVIEHGLNTGIVEGTSHYVGGFVGIINKCTATITDSLNTGSILRVDGNRSGYYGAIAGGVNGEKGLECDATFKNVFFLDDSCAKGYQIDNNNWRHVTINGQGAIALTEEELTGNNANVWASLDFKNYWTAVNNSTPILRSFAKNPQKVYGSQLADYSWYSANGSNFTIKNAKQLWAFSILSRTDDFKGKTVNLGADITVNNTSENWKPIGRNVTQEGKAIGKTFAGTFNGNGHTISGLYIHLNSAKAYNWGLFAKISGKIQNLKLIDSTISGVAGGSVGSIAGSLAGATLENVYSNATVSITSGKNTAGLAGIIEGKAASTISNCWFDGSVSGVERVGGFAGSIDAASSLTIAHGLNTGSVKSSSNYVGGFLGLMNKSGLTVSDSLNTGSVTTTSKTSYIGAISGGLNGAATAGGEASFENVYFLNGSCTKGYQVDGNNKAYVNVSGNGVVLLNAEELTGNNAYIWSMLDFDSYWTTVKNAMPMLRVFAAKTEKVSGEKMVSFGWHTLEGASHTISSTEELWGLTLLSRTDSFAGETITLAKDIDLSGTDWQPIGKHEVASKNVPGQVFAGIFDGAGHKITGMTMSLVNGNKIWGLFGQVSGTIRNVTLANAEISGTASGKVGSVAGVLAGGALENVHVDAKVDVESNFVGGLVGSVEGKTASAIKNSSFTGEVAGNKHIGGLVGYINASSVDVIGSENNGSISTKVKDSNVGGLIGYAQRSATVITDSKNNGIVSLNGFAGKLGTVIGRLDGDSTGNASVVFTNVENTKEQGVTGGVPGYNADKDQYETITGDVKDTSHTVTHVAAVTPTCKVEGNVEYWYCSVCNTVWLDETQTQIADQESVKLATVDHSFEDGTCSICGAEDPNYVPDPNKPSTEWYDPDKGTAEEPYIIATKGDLLGLAQLAETVDFAGKIIKLTADIDLTGEAWWPIGRYRNSTAMTGVAFAGTFDGGNHTVTGMTIAATGKEGYLGFFGTVTGTVKNLVLTNASVTGTAANNRVGSVAGSLQGGTLENVHSTASINVSANFVGGLAGIVETGTQSTIRNCSFNGTVEGNKHDGGLVGYVNSSSAEITGSENKGAVTTKADNDGGVGGLIGYVQNSTVTVTDSKNSGTATGAGTKNNVGTLIGRIQGDSAAKTANVTLGECTAKDGEAYNITGTKGNTTVIIKHSITHTAAVVPTCEEGGNVEYWYCSACNGVWTDEALTQIADLESVKQAANGHSYVDDVCSVCGKIDPNSSTPDTTWYDSEASAYSIGSKSELYGLAKLAAEGNTFEGKTVTLTADIDLTGETWVPIAAFSGTFDGGNHTITGLSVSQTTEGLGFFKKVASGTVQNLTLATVTIQGSGNKAGAVAGTLDKGTLRNVHCTGTVNTSGNQVGGLVGQIDGGSADSVIDNCSFQGSVTGAKNVGGLVGFVNAAKSLQMTGCTNNAAVTIKASGARAGGLIGYANNTLTIEISNCTNNGAVNGTGSLGSIVGVIQGTSNKKVAVTLTNVTNTTVMETGYNLAGASYVTVNGTVTNTAIQTLNIPEDPESETEEPSNP